MQGQNTSPFEYLMQQIGTLPLWIKQVIYQQIRADLELSMSKPALDTFGAQDLLQLWVPTVTPVGRRELELPNGQGDASLKQLFYLASMGKSVLHICVHHQWNLEQCSILLYQALERQLIQTPTSGIIEATIHYLANHIRIGEYLVKIGRLQIEQLDQALRTQKYIEDALGEKSGLADVLINLGYINRHDSDGILFLKDESKKSLKGLLANTGAAFAAKSVSPTTPERPMGQASSVAGGGVMVLSGTVGGLGQGTAQPDTANAGTNGGKVQRPVWSFK
jgi:hypothetical protein